jgi:zinc transport system substrate-binding protein
LPIRTPRPLVECLWLAAAGIALLAGAVMPSCQRSAATPARPMTVVVTITPLKGLVQPLLPPDAKVTVLIPQGRSEHGYELTASDVLALSQADMVVDVGLSLVPQVTKYLADHPSSKRVASIFADEVGIRLSGEPAHEEHHDADHDDDEDEHHHGGTDPHLWLDPGLVLKFVPALGEDVRKALQARGELTPESRQRLDAVQAKLAADVQSIDDSYRTRLKPFAGRPIVTHHSAWKRLAERYGLTVAAVIRPIETSEPTPQAISDAVKAVREQHVSVIFVEPQFSPQAAERIAAQTGVHTATLDPLGDGDWAALMRKNLDSLAENLGR